MEDLFGQLEGATISDVKYIKPGTPEQTGFPFENRLDEFKQGKMKTGLRKSHLGEIVFGKARISPDEASESVLEKKFTLHDSIFIRPYWARAISNYPLALENDKPIYGPERIFYQTTPRKHLFNLHFFLTVDGKPIQGKGKDGAMFTLTQKGVYIKSENLLLQYEGGMQKYKNNDSASLDFYGLNQTLNMQLVGVANIPDDSFKLGSIEFSKIAREFTAGEHKIKLDLCFTLSPGPLNQGDFPDQETIMSHPIASGEFVLVVDEAGKKNIGKNGLFKRAGGKISIDDAEKIEAEVKDWLSQSPEWGARKKKTEECVRVVISGEWYRTHDEVPVPDEPGYYTKVPSNWAVPVNVLFRRRKGTGWPNDSFEMFDLSALGSKNGTHGPIVGVMVGENKEIESDLAEMFIKT